MKTRNTLLVFLLIIVQSALAIIVGAVALLGASEKSVPAGVRVGDLHVGGMSYYDAAAAIEKNYENKFKTASLQLQIENGESFEIPFSSIDADVDGNETLLPLRKQKGIKDTLVLFQNYFGHYRPSLQPAVRFNEGKLRESLLEISERIRIEPVNAEITYQAGIIEKKAETDGLELNIANSVEVIRQQLSANPLGTVLLSCAKNFELQSVVPEIRLKDYDDIQQVLAEYTTDIIDTELSDSIRLAVDAINGVVLPAAGNAETPQVFSFVEWLKKEDAGFENDNEGYDQVASTLYATLLMAGIPSDSITRLPHKLSVDYIEPGLDAWISGNAGDLRFTNTFSHKVAVFAQMDENTVRVVLAGSMSDKKEKLQLKTEIVQRFAPPVYNVENKSLKPGESVVLNPGKEGLMVSVFRNGELLSTDKYEAEKKIVQVGPGAGSNQDEK